jgi:DNA-binding Lrp family transcriptional regulator
MGWGWSGEVDVKLSKNEKMILWGLVRFPMMNDRELSDRISIRMSTLNAIKNKMKRSGIIYDRIVPNIEVMDYELLAVSWMPLSHPIRDPKEQRFLLDLFSGYPNAYSVMVFSDTLFSLSLYKSYTQFRVAEQGVKAALRDRAMLSIEEPHSTLYPLSVSRLNKNFDYTSVLERAFDIDPTDDAPGTDPDSLESARNKFFHLTNKERTILKGILKAPDMPDNKVASLLDTTRQAVARHKKELLDLGVIKKTRVINYGGLGFNILCMVEAHYDRETEASNEYPDTRPLHLPSFFSIYGMNETVSLSLFQDFKDFSRSRESYTELMKGHYRIRGEPIISLFSPSDTFTIKHQDYLPLVERFLSSGN